jgi:hypothetical protein
MRAKGLSRTETEVERREWGSKRGRDWDAG